MPKVYVLNRHGRPLMPCTPAKARHLLDAGKAKVRHRRPFTIQLLYGSTVLDASSILSLCCLGLNRPLTVRVCGGEQSEDFCRAIQPYLVEPANAG